MVQRFLTWPLMVRFHYGHPDVDKVWAFSNGGVSKASKTLHVSEDIFGGLNVVPAVVVERLQYIHCARHAISVTAVTASSRRSPAGTRSRACRATCTRWRAFRPLPAALDVRLRHGAFVSSSLMFWALYWFAVAIALLALVGLESFQEDSRRGYIDIVDTGTGSVYASQWFLQLGFALALPFFLECCGTLGVLGALRELGLQVLRGKVLFTLFIERTRAYYLHCGLTSAPHAMSPLAARLSRCHQLCRPLLDVRALALPHRRRDALPPRRLLPFHRPQRRACARAYVAVWLVVLSILISPWFFNPRAFQGLALLRNMHEFFAWLDTDEIRRAHRQTLRTCTHAARRWPRRLHACSAARAARAQGATGGRPEACPASRCSAATAALHIEPIGNGRYLNLAIFRTWITLLAAVLYLLLTLIYWQLATPASRGLWRVAPREALYLWALRSAALGAFLLACGSSSPIT